MTKFLTYLFTHQLPSPVAIILSLRAPAPTPKAQISAHRMMSATLGSDKKAARDWVAH